jgi:hypothetical protein
MLNVVIVLLDRAIQNHYTLLNSELDFPIKSGNDQYNSFH